VKLLRSLCAALIVLATSPVAAEVAIGVSVNLAPPALPVYVQPPIPSPGYMWSPGYWAWGPAGYYWVPGTWVQPPSVGVLWTPPWWGWVGGAYVFHAGYWGPHVGFYGGVNYGFGYGGVGFLGGRWQGGVFAYNHSVTNFGGVHVTNVYNETVVNKTVVNHVSFNGGAGGLRAAPTASDRIAEREQHFQPTGPQADHEHAAGADRSFLASENHGHPAVAAAARPGEFHGPGAPHPGAPGGQPHPQQPHPHPQERPHPEERH